MMKVILRAFGGKLRSKPMEFPDETSPTIHLMLDLDTLKYSMKDGGAIPDKTTFKRGRFEMMAHSELLDNNEFARIFVLVGID